MRTRDVSQANLNVRLPSVMHRRLQEAAERRGVPVSDFVRPMLQYLATLDDADPVWGELGYLMTRPAIPPVPVSRN